MSGEEPILGIYMVPLSQKKSSVLTALVSVAGVLLVFTGLYYFFIDPFYSRIVQLKVNDAVSSSTIPEELKDASYLLTASNGGGTFVNGKLLYDEYAKDGSVVLDVAVEGDTAAKILYMPSVQEYEVSVNGVVVLTTEKYIKNLFLSDEGTRVSFAVSDFKYASEDVKLWSTVILDVATRQTWDVAGFAAPFKDSKSVYAFRTDGVYVVEYEAGTEVVNLPLQTNYIYPSIAQNENRTKLAWVTYTGEASVYESVEDETLPLLRLFSKRGIVGTLALTDRNLYVITPKNNGSTIMRHSIYGDDSEQVRSLPSILSISKILP